MSKEETWLTRDELMEKFHYKQATFYIRRNECLVSPYADAIILDGHKPMFILERWKEFLKWKSKKELEKKLGTQSMRQKNSFYRGV
ncbi:hypothetical protein [Lactobacillus taiwanensis]|uniref:hypothetical protein n=1 Tax=Lactobacillus taiwanensis TaxID=508451 RepID=UPI00243014E6|nr:hypothetical protein [Lactobacillus taiwanensis]